MYAALIMFVVSMPQVIAHTLLKPISYFSVLQISGIAAFMAGASQSGRWIEKYGSKRVVKIGSILQVVGGMILVILSLISEPAFALIVAGYTLFNGGVGFRGPILFAKSLDGGLRAKTWSRSYLKI